MSQADKQIHTELPILDLPGLAAFKDAVVVRVCMHWVYFFLIELSTCMVR